MFVHMSNPERLMVLVFCVAIVFGSIYSFLKITSADEKVVEAQMVEVQVLKNTG